MIESNKCRYKNVLANRQTNKLINTQNLPLLMIPFIKKYEPKEIKDIYGQDKAVKQINDFVSNYKKQKKKAALIFGPVGVGKTCSVYAIANELNLEVVEVNASDFRNKEQINEKVGSATMQQSLFSKGKIILIDEIDGLSGTKDRGGIQALAKLTATSAFPIILTATNPWDNKFSGIRKKSMMVEFDPLENNDIYDVLKNICEKEKIKYKEDVLKQLARMSAGDLRGAVNDLQLLTQDKKKLRKEELDELSERNKEESIINALLKIFKTKDAKIAINAFENVNEDFNQRFLWIDENLPKEYENPEDLARAYNAMSRADVFNGRIKRWQHWRFLVYINALLTAGIAVSKDEKYKKFVQYKPTGRILKLWWAKQKSFKKKAIAAKIAEKTHSSSKEVIKNVLPYVQIIFKKNKKMRNDLIEELELDKDEVGWLSK